MFAENAFGLPAPQFQVSHRVMEQEMLNVWWTTGLYNPQTWNMVVVTDTPTIQFSDRLDTNTWSRKLLKQFTSYKFHQLGDSGVFYFLF